MIIPRIRGYHGFNIEYLFKLSDLEFFIKFRLTTLMFLVALCAVSIGWYVDHRDSQTKTKAIVADFDAQLDVAALGFICYHELDTLLPCYSDFQHLPPEQFSKTLKRKMVFGILRLWELENEIDSTMTDELHPAMSLAQDMLDWLDCPDADTFTELAFSTIPGGIPGSYRREIHDSSSQEYKSFHKFLSRASDGG